MDELQSQAVLKLNMTSLLGKILVFKHNFYYKVLVIVFVEKSYITSGFFSQRRMKNTVKHLRWGFLRKQLIARAAKAPSHMPDWVLNTPICYHLLFYCFYQAKTTFLKMC